MDAARDMSSGHLRTCILLPVYNDWPCFPKLLTEIDQSLSACGSSGIVVIVNDGGNPISEEVHFLVQKYDGIAEFRMLELIRNLGNQNALTIGLSFIRDEIDCDVVIVMDSDGQDAPSDLLKLFAACREQPQALIVAERSGRSEGIVFRACYQLYRATFRILVGKRMTFGNYSIIPAGHLPRLCSMAELPVNFAAALIKSRLPLQRVPCFRGGRYDGVSTQNIVGLIIHGVNAILVFGEIALVRVTLFSGLLVAAALLGIIAVSAIRVFTHYAVPGWASNTVGILVLLIGQALLFSLLATLVRGRNPISLIVDPKRYRLAIASAISLKCTRSVRAGP